MDIQAILAVVAKWVPIALSFIGSFALLAVMTPNKTDDKIIQFLLDLVNFLGANFKNAKNEKDD